MRGNYITPNTFDVLGVQPILGRATIDSMLAPAMGRSRCSAIATGRRITAATLHPGSRPHLNGIHAPLSASCRRASCGAAATSTCPSR